MRKGNCPKCGSDDVYCGKDIVLKSGPFGSNSIPISLTSIAALDNYICVQCGFMESYISDENKLEEISRKWQKANQPDEWPDETND